MKTTLAVEEGTERTFVLILDEGEEAFAAISGFAADKGLSAASLTAIGAFERAKVGWFDLEAKRYRPIPVEEQCEALSLIGDIATDDEGQPSLHMHAVLGLKDGSTRGGHFLEGVVRPTLEVTLVETAAHLRRRKRPDLGIALIDPNAERQRPAMTVKQRIDEALDRIGRLGAKAVRIVLTEADLDELRGEGGAYKGVPVGKGEIGGHSYIETEGAPSGDTNFAI